MQAEAEHGGKEASVHFDLFHIFVHFAVCFFADQRWVYPQVAPISAGHAGQTATPLKSCAHHVLNSRVIPNSYGGPRLLGCNTIRETWSYLMLRLRFLHCKTRSTMLNMVFDFQGTEKSSTTQTLQTALGPSNPGDLRPLTPPI